MRWATANWQEELVKDAAWYGRRILPIAVLQTANVVMKLCSMELPFAQALCENGT